MEVCLMIENFKRRCHMMCKNSFDFLKLALVISSFVPDVLINTYIQVIHITHELN